MQEDADERGGLAIDATDEVIVFRCKFNPRHVLQAQRGSIRIRADDDVLEFTRLGQAALGGDRIDQFLRPSRGRLPDLARRELRILFVQGCHEVAGRDAQLRHAVRFHPDPHGVILGTEYLDIRGAGNPLENIQHVERGVIADIKVVKTAIG